MNEIQYKRTVKYLIYLIVLVGLYYLGSSILAECYEQTKRTFTYNHWLITLVQLIFFGGIGVVLGLDRFLLELNREGKWHFDITKLIILGIPSLIFSMPYLVFIFIKLPNSFSNICTISSIILGYTLISNPYKDPSVI